MRKTIICAETGEIIEQRGDAFFMVYTRHNFTRDKRLSLTEIRIFGLLCEIMTRDGYITHTQSWIARKLDIAPPNLSRALKHLRELNYIIHGTLHGRRLLRVNPLCVSKRRSSVFRAEMECAEEGEEYG